MEHPPPMSAIKPSPSYKALRDRVEIVLKVFEAADYEPISLPVIQPAGLFLDTMGESVRSRTYLFNDHFGHELCLRPDLTVPTCRHFLDSAAGAPHKARYSYHGPVFRFRQDGVGLGQPDEIRQTGIESFGETDRAGADADILRLTLDALRAAGLKRFDVTIGDIGLFTALLAGIDMPDRWRRQLQHLFFQPKAFDRYFEALHGPRSQRAAEVPAGILAALAGRAGDDAETALLAHFASQGITHVGNRAPAEIAARLLEQIEDAKLDPLPSLYARLINAYLTEANVKPPETARSRIHDLARLYKVDVDAALDTFSERLKMLAKADVTTSEMSFSTAIGRDFEYYTGFVFEVRATVAGESTVVAGGGRYDGLVRAIDGNSDVPAVGAAIYMDRLLAAIRG
jgi:ATP phosphoribosyltransferase regulatory subunit